MGEHPRGVIENNVGGESSWRKKIARLYSYGAGLMRNLGKNRWMRGVIQVVVIGFCIFFLATNLTSAKDIFSFSSVNSKALIASLFASIAAVFLGTLGWWFTLKSFGHRPTWLESARVHLLANLAKYVPGYAWQLVGKAYLSKNLNLSPKQSGLAMLTEFAQLISLGLVISFVLLPQDLITRWLGASIFANKVILGAGIVILATALLPLLSRLLKNSPRYLSNLQIQPTLLASASLAILVGWLALGLSFWLLGLSLMPVDLNDLPFFIFTLTAAFIIGLMIVFVPGSIGVRESLIVVILITRFPNASQAVLIGILSRVIITIGELISTGVVLLLHRWNLSKLKGYTAN